MTQKRFDGVTKENIKQHSPKWPQVPDHPYRILIIRCSGSVKPTSLFNLIHQQQDIYKIYLYVKDKAKYQLLTNKRESTGLSNFNDSKLLLNTQMIWMIFMTILKNTIQIKKVKY